MVVVHLPCLVPGDHTGYDTLTTSFCDWVWVVNTLNPKALAAFEPS